MNTEIKIEGNMQVKLVHVCPEIYAGKTADCIIASSARASFKNFSVSKTEEDDKRLIFRLLKDRHTSPFEMASLTFLITAPKFVIIHLLRHRTFKFNEESQRYHKVSGEYFKPSSNPKLFIRRQHFENKQSSISDEDFSGKALGLVKEAEKQIEKLNELYEEMLAAGIARECARFCLPISCLSTIVVQCDMNNFLKFLTLRLASDAQFETQLIARAMYYLASQVFPITMDAFDNFMFDEEKMSLDTTAFIQGQ